VHVDLQPIRSTVDCEEEVAAFDVEHIGRIAAETERLTSLYHAFATESDEDEGCIEVYLESSYLVVEFLELVLDSAISVFSNFDDKTHGSSFQGRSFLQVKGGGRCENRNEILNVLIHDGSEILCATLLDDIDGSAVGLVQEYGVTTNSNQDIKIGSNFIRISLVLALLEGVPDFEDPRLF
jgi:hypothetical protein